MRDNQAYSGIVLAMTKFFLFLPRPCAQFLCCLLIVLTTTLGTPGQLLAQVPTPLLPFAAQSTPAASSAEEAVVARVYFTDQTDLNRLAATYDVWHVHHSNALQSRYFVALLSTTELTELRAAGYRVEIDEQRTAQLYLYPVLASTPQAGIPGFPCYRTLNETYTDLETLANTYPTLARWVDIGDSWDKAAAADASGFDIQALVLTNQAMSIEKPVFFLMAAIHAREYTTAELATRFAEYLINNYGKDADVTWLLDYTEIHIVPQANPDGRVRAEGNLLWRKNTNRDSCPNENPFFSYYGVDLNRNSSFKWNGCEGSGCSTSQGCFDTYRGTTPASEPETQALQNYMATLFPDQRAPADTAAVAADATGLMISIHSYGQLVLFPWGWRSTTSPNHTALETLGRKFGYFNGSEVCQAGEPGCIYQTDGSTDDWAYGELGVAAYTFELGTNFFEQCTYFEENLVDQNIAALLYAAKAARRPYQSPAGPETIQITASITSTPTGAALAIQATANDTRYDSNGWGIEPSQVISAARLSIDAPSWITTTQHYTMTATDGLLDRSIESMTGIIDIRDWGAEKHLVFVEGQDVAGNWGAPTALFVEISPTSLSVEGEPMAPFIIANRLYLPLVAQSSPPESGNSDFP